MGAGILNLVTNSGEQNIWLNQDPQITFFKCVYRRHTPFATETIPLQFNTKLDFGKSATVKILPHADLVHRMFLEFDLPKLSASFPNTKSTDILNLINTSNISDTEFVTEIKKYVRSDCVEFDQVFDLIDNYVQTYNTEITNRLAIVDKLNNYLVTDTELTKLPNCHTHSKSQIKNSIIDLWISQKSEYYLINEILKFMYDFETAFAHNTTIISTDNIANILITDHIFGNLIPDNNIYSMFISTNKCADVGYPNTIDHANFGSCFHDVLNSYNIVINITNTLAKTVPIVIVKPYAIAACNYNIYNDTRCVNLDTAYFTAITDPNFKLNFKSGVNIFEKYCENNIFMPTDYVSTYSKLYPTNMYSADPTNMYSPDPSTSSNKYIGLFNNQSTTLFNNIQYFIDKLFEKYRQPLFCSTDKLFFNNSLSMSNIYGYIIPKTGPVDDSCLKIQNVFNTNIWFFYFFKYLDMLDTNSFVCYIKDTARSHTLFTLCGMSFMGNLLTLLKINIEYYMNEISYLLNDLYASSPSVHQSDSMKNYVPSSHNTYIDNCDIRTNLLAITIIFHRNHVPTISEIEKFIYHFIDTMDTNRINKYLVVDIDCPSNDEIHIIRQILKQFYRQIFGYFATKYRDFYYGANSESDSKPNSESDSKPNNEPNTEPNTDLCSDIISAIDLYVKYFLHGTPVKNHNKYYQQSLSHVICQMEFYFIAESIHMTELSKFYQIILDHDTVCKSTDSKTALVAKFVTDSLKAGLNTHNGSNIHNGSDLYYSTTNTDRYYGNAYLDTSYISRNFGPVVKPSKPMPLPPTRPHGINTSYYNHNQIFMDCVQLPVNNNNILDSNMPVYWTSNPPDTYSRTSSLIDCSELDYFRLKHSVFGQNNFIMPPNIVVVNEYQFNLLRTVKLTAQLDHNTYNKCLFQWLSESVFYILKHSTNADIICQLDIYLDNIESSICAEKNCMTDHYMAEISVFVNELFISTDDMCDQFTSTDLINLNKYVASIIANPDSTHIIDKLELIRDHYISQYYYYVKYQKSISKIYSLNLINNSQNASQIAYLVTESICSVDLTPIKTMSAKMSQNLDMYIDKVLDIVGVKNILDDFSCYILEYFYGFDPNTVTKLTSADVYDLINNIFVSINSIYHNCSNIDHIIEILAKYQPILLDKVLLIKAIGSIYHQFPNNAYCIAKLAQSYGIDFDAYLQYLNLNIDTINLDTICRDLDYFLIKYRLSDVGDMGLSLDDMETGTNTNIVLRDIIITDIVGGTDNTLKLYLESVSNEYYSLVYTYLVFARGNNILAINPLNRNTINDCTNIISAITMCMDHVADSVMVIGGKNPIIDNLLGYDVPFSAQFDKITDLSTDLSTTDLSTTNIVTDLSINNYIKAIDLSKDIAERGIYMANQYKTDIVRIKAIITDIMYRNKTAKTAWIRKLGHFIIESATFRSSNQTNEHISDWFEILNEVSGNIGTSSAYNKMIGHREDLIVFDNAEKKSYSIVVPLVFYFNKNVALSIPLNASSHTLYEINIKLRPLADVCYKEEFSEFNCKPVISNCQLMTEYVYLSTEERAIFATSQLEYLIDEVQYSTTFVTNHMLKPIYQICPKKSVSRIKNKIKITDEINDRSKFSYTDTVEDPTLMVCRDDYLTKPYVNKSGIVSTSMVYSPIPIDKYIHRQRLCIENKFNNPTKFMAIIIKPSIHTNLDIRSTAANNLYCQNYFHGEKQWDNYGIYSYYDLSNITNAKNAHYEHIRAKMADLDDIDFGFVNIINQLLYEKMVDQNEKLADQISCVNIPDDPHTNLSDTSYNVTQLLQIVKDAYMNYHGEIIYGSNIIRLKEQIASLAIDYNITNADELDQMIAEFGQTISNYAEYDYDTNSICLLSGLDNDNGTMTKDAFIQVLVELFGIDTTDPLQIKIINMIYQKHNLRQINIVVDAINTIYDICSIKYDFNNIIAEFYHYTLTVTTNTGSTILAKHVAEIYNRSGVVENTPIKNSTIKDVIYQLGIDISITDISTIAELMACKLTELVNNYYVELIDYKLNLIENPKINPLISANFVFNDTPTIPANTTTTYWSNLQAYMYFKLSPSTGINLHSWALNPSINTNQPDGSINLSKIDKFESVLDIHPLISDVYPAQIVSIINSINLVRYISGMNGTAW